MILLEDKELEAMVLSRNSCIAVPIEVYIPEEGETVITVYSCVADVAKEYESKFSDGLLKSNALKWLDDKLYATAKEFGYVHFEEDIHFLAEYRIDDESQLHKNCLADAKIISDESELEGIDLSLIENIIPNGNTAVVIRDGKLVAAAAANDVVFEDSSVEIYVETAPEYRNRGFGAAAVAELALMYLKRGMCVRYKCAKNNLPSIKTAEKCGFVKIGERYSYVCFATDENDNVSDI